MKEIFAVAVACLTIAIGFLCQNVDFNKNLKSFESYAIVRDTREKEKGMPKFKKEFKDKRPVNFKIVL